MSSLHDFLVDLKNNSQLRKSMPAIGDDLFDRFIREADCQGDRIWVELDPPPGWNTLPSNILTSFYNGDAGVGQATDIIKMPVSGNFLLMNYNQLPGVFSDKWIYQGRMPYGRYGTSGWNTNPDMIGYGYTACFNEDETRFIYASYYYHYIKCFDNTTGQLLWSFGTGGTGAVEDGRCQSPRGVLFLPNGNVLVACYAGRFSSASSYNYGSVFELDISDGSVVRKLLEYEVGNYGWMNRGGVYNPTRMWLDGTKVFIPALGRDEVGVFETDSGAFDYIRSYLRPPGLDYDSANPRCGCPGPNNTFAVYSETTHQIVGIDKDTGEFRWVAGIPAASDAKNHPRNLPHELNNVQGMYYDVDNDRIIVADYGNQRVMALAFSNNHTIQYPPAPVIPGYDLVVHPIGYDPATSKLTIPINTVSNYGFVCSKPGAIVIGYQRSECT